MSCVAFVSAANRPRIRRAEAWLESRPPAEELLIVGATLDAANELARSVGKKKGAAFGWHRMTLPQLAFAIAAGSGGARTSPAQPTWRRCNRRAARTPDERRWQAQPLSIGLPNARVFPRGRERNCGTAACTNPA